MNKRKCKYVFVFLTAILFVSISGVNASIFGRVRKYKPNPVFCPKPIKVLDEFVGKSLPLNDDTFTVNLWGEEVELEINPIRLDDGNDEMEMAMAMSSAIEPNQFDPDDVVILDGGFVTESMELSSYSANPRQGGPNGRATGKRLVQTMQYQGSEADPNSWDIITSNVGRVYGRLQNAINAEMQMMALDGDPNVPDDDPNAPDPRLFFPDPLYTTSQVWTPDRIYMLEYPVVFEGNGVFLKILPDTIVVNGSYGKLNIRDGARLITGMTGEQSYIDPNDFDATGNPVMPAWFLAESLGLWVEYVSAIVIEESALPSIINNVFIEGAGTAIVVKNGSSVIGNYIYGCKNGILSTGHYNHLIVNNQLWYLGQFDLTPDHPNYGIKVETDPVDPNLIEKPTISIVANNTVHDGGIGIIGDGHLCQRCDNEHPLHHDPNDVAPELYFMNNITTFHMLSAYGFFNGIVKPSVLHPGLGANSSEINIPLEFVNPVWTYENPYDSVNDYRQFFLNRNSVFVDAGLGTMIDVPYLLGMTTSTLFQPDETAIDLGVHYQHSLSNKNQEYLITDFDRSGFTDIDDFAGFSSGWGTFTSLDKWPYDPNDFHIDPNDVAYKADLNEDGIVDSLDLVQFTDNWLVYSEYSSHPEYILSVDNDPDDLSHDVSLTVDGFVSNPKYTFLWMDNTFLGRIDYRNDGDESYGIDFNSANYGNGLHRFRVVSYDDPNGVTVSDSTELYFNNRVHDLRVSLKEGFISGLYDGNHTLSGTISDAFEGDVYWSDSYTGHAFNWSIPELPFGNVWETVIAEVEDPNGTLMSNSMLMSFPPLTDEEYDSWVERVSPEFTVPDPNDPAYANFTKYQAILILPNPSLTRNRGFSIKEQIIAYRKKKIYYLILYGENANAINVARGLTLPNMHYVYILAHGNYRSGFPWNRTNRSFFEIDDTRVFCWLGRDTPDPDDDNALGHWERDALNLWDLGLYYRNNIKIVFLDSCYLGRTDEMARAFGMFSYSNTIWKDQIAISWDKWASARALDYTTFVAEYWKYMAQGYSVTHAIRELLIAPPGGGTSGWKYPTDNIRIGGPGNVETWGLLIKLERK